MFHLPPGSGPAQPRPNHPTRPDRRPRLDDLHDAVGAPGDDAAAPRPPASRFRGEARAPPRRPGLEQVPERRCVARELRKFLPGVARQRPQAVERRRGRGRVGRAPQLEKGLLEQGQPETLGRVLRPREEGPI